MNNLSLIFAFPLLIWANSIEDHPQDISNDSTVRVCGKVSGNVIRLDPPISVSGNEIRNMQIINREKNKKYRRCISGNIVYLGCNNPEKMCTDWTEDYGINVDY